MKSRLAPLLMLALTAALGLSFSVAVQKKSLQPDLAKLAEGKDWKVTGRKISVINDGNRKALQFDEAAGQGLALLEGVEFTNGEIDLQDTDEMYRCSVVGPKK